MAPESAQALFAVVDHLIRRTAAFNRNHGRVPPGASGEVDSAIHAAMQALGLDLERSRGARAPPTDNAGPIEQR